MIFWCTIEEHLSHLNRICSSLRSMCFSIPKCTAWRIWFLRIESPLPPYAKTDEIHRYLEPTDETTLRQFWFGIILPKIHSWFCQSSFPSLYFDKERSSISVDVGQTAFDQLKKRFFAVLLYLLICGLGISNYALREGSSNRALCVVWDYIDSVDSS